MQIKLAEALLRRKELQAKVDQLKTIKTQESLLVVKTTRKGVHEGIDDVIASVPVVSVSEITAAHDWHARQLRQIDAVIQQTNWTAEITVADEVMANYTPPAQLRRG